jgi:putative tryptophan/tyrosine transport system substrate-binding protein
MSSRREFIALLCGLVAWPVAARSQQAERIRRIGVLMGIEQADPDAKPAPMHSRSGSKA